MDIIILGVVMFTLIVLVLTGLILFAKSKLVNTGEIKVEINGDPDKSFEAPAGDKLLNMLANQGFLYLQPVAAAGLVDNVVSPSKKVAAIFYLPSFLISASVKRKKAAVYRVRSTLNKI